MPPVFVVVLLTEVVVLVLEFCANAAPPRLSTNASASARLIVLLTILFSFCDRGGVRAAEVVKTNRSGRDVARARRRAGRTPRPARYVTYATHIRAKCVPRPAPAAPRKIKPFAAAPRLRPPSARAPRVAACPAPRTTATGKAGGKREETKKR